MTRRGYRRFLAAACACGLAACSPAAAQVSDRPPASPVSAAPAPARTSVETVAASTAAVDLLYHPAAAAGALVHSGVFGPTLRLLITELNTLPTQSPSAKACPLGTETAQLTVYEGKQDLQLRVSLGGKRTEPDLQDSEALESAIEAVVTRQDPPR